MAGKRRTMFPPVSPNDEDEIAIALFLLRSLRYTYGQIQQIVNLAHSAEFRRYNDRVLEIAKKLGIKDKYLKILLETDIHQIKIKGNVIEVKSWE